MRNTGKWIAGCCEGREGRGRKVGAANSIVGLPTIQGGGVRGNSCILFHRPQALWRCQRVSWLAAPSRSLLFCPFPPFPLLPAPLLDLSLSYPGNEPNLPPRADSRHQHRDLPHDGMCSHLVFSSLFRAPRNQTKQDSLPPTLSVSSLPYQQLKSSPHRLTTASHWHWQAPSTRMGLLTRVPLTNPSNTLPPRASSGEQPRNQHTRTHRVRRH